MRAMEARRTSEEKQRDSGALKIFDSLENSRSFSLACLDGRRKKVR